MPTPFVILTGASGVGKTTIARAIENLQPHITVFRFDTIGVPSPEVMATYGPGHQPGGAWQRAMTFQWFERIASVLKLGTPVLFEGQMRIAFIQEALATYAISNARVILVECADGTRDHRLIHDRNQPDLANESMKGWSRYLHQEAVDAGYEILDTSSLTLSESIQHVARLLQIEPKRYSIEDLWRTTDAGQKPTRVMSFDEMNASKGPKE